MKGRHFAVKEKTKKRTKSIALSVVALLELLLLVTSVTFSWFEGLTSLELKGEKFKTASVLNSHIEVGENTSNSDSAYTKVINLSSFFDAQKEVRLSPVSSSDAVNFYASYSGTPGAEGTKYRKLTKEDINANIIQFQFNISSADGLTDVYLTDALPKVTIDGTTYDYTDTHSYPFRFAFSDGATTIILKNSKSLDSNDGTAAKNQPAITSLSSTDTALLATGKVDRTQEYAYYQDNRETVKAPTADGAGKDTPVKPIFQIEKGKTKTITMTVWLEAFDYNYTTDLIKPGSEISFDVKLCTSWSTTCDITVYDYSSDQFIDDYDVDTNNSANTMALYIENADGTANPRRYELTYNGDHTWSGTIPNSLKYCRFVWKPKNNNSFEVTLNDNYRGNYTEVTLLGSKANMWGLTPDELTTIEFRDYTTGGDEDGWINDDKGSVYAGIIYNGQYLEYAMNSHELKPDGEKSDVQFKDTYGKITWKCWIPKTVNSVNFIRRADDNNTEYNYWYANDRGTNSVYRATDDGITGTFAPYIVYVQFYNNTIASRFAEGRPYISITESNNQAKWDSVKLNSNLSQFNTADYKPKNDTWINGNGGMSRKSDTLWYTVFESKPDNDTTYTVWTRSTAKYNEADKNISFGEFTFSKTATANTINITAQTKMTAGDNPQNNYALTGTTALKKNDANISYGGSLKKGLWGELTPPDEGSYTTYFVHTSNADSVTVSYTYNSVVFSTDMVVGTDGKTWSTNKIPDDYTGNITFTDSNGNTWTASSANRSSTYDHYYVVTSSTGKGFVAEIVTTGTIEYSFKHYTSASAVTVSYTYQGVPFKFTLKGSNNLWTTKNIPDDYSGNITYSDGTNSWTVAKNSNKTRCYAISKYKAEIGATNLIRVYLRHNWDDKWKNFQVHYWGGETYTTWGNFQSITEVAAYNSYHVYCALVPSDSNGMLFVTYEYGTTLKQTVNVAKSNITDMKGLYFNNWSGDKITIGTWSNVASTLNSYSTK